MNYPPRVSAVDWSRWVPTERATLLFVIQNGRLLLIHKKKGLGAGKINGPGGRIGAGEAAEHAAVREVREELHIHVRDPRWAGELKFQFTDGFGMHGIVFTASAFEGEPQSTSEADPLWVPIRQIPFDEMWEDDRIWFPFMLAGIPFQGFFIFDGDHMLDYGLEAGPHLRCSV